MAGEPARASCHRLVVTGSENVATPAHTRPRTLVVARARWRSPIYADVGAPAAPVCVHMVCTRRKVIMQAGLIQCAQQVEDEQ